LTVLRDLDLIHFGLPQNRRLVPLDVLNQSEYKSAVQFGIEMGTGVRTYLSASAPYMVAAYLLLSSAPVPDVFAAAMGFAVGRWMMLLGHWATGGGAWRRAVVTHQPVFLAGLALLVSALLVYAAIGRLANLVG